MTTRQKIAIVTGGGSGLGLAIASRFTQQNITTYIIGRNQQKLNDAAAALGPNARIISADLTELSLVPIIIDQIFKKEGHIDILVNNAGINLKKEFTEVTDEEFQSLLLTNVTSVFAVSREVVKVMLKQQSGSIINISSMAAQYGLPKVIGYTASKTAIEGMTRAMATELSPKGIRINCIAPGFIETNMSAKALDSDPERKHRVMTRTPMNKLGKPSDVANMAYFLASDESVYLTGTIIPVDGGNSIGF